MNKLITLSVTNIDTANRLAVLKMKKECMYNFFTSYMNDRFEFYHEPKLNEFFGNYTLATLEFDELINKTMREQLPVGVVDFIVSQPHLFCIQFSYLNSEIVIVEKTICNNKESTNGSETSLVT